MNLMHYAQLRRVARRTAVLSFGTLSERSVRLGILKETYNPWERRVPLTPNNVRNLLQSGLVDQVMVQPSGQRVFSDLSYKQAGAILTEDLSSADLILGVKRPTNTLLSKKAYMFFTHTKKGQLENIDLLKDAVAKQTQLFDYECLETVVNQKPVRLISFGRFAGLAGALETLHAVGRRLLLRGQSTPFLHCPQAYTFESLAQANERLRQIGEEISAVGLQQPLVISLTGRGGRVYSGAMEILHLLPHEYVCPSDLPEIVSEQDDHHHKIYLCPLNIADVMEPVDRVTPFDRALYNEHPSRFVSALAERVGKYSDVLIHTAYWEDRYPRMLSKKALKEIFLAESKPRLFLVTDISCDKQGSMEFLGRTTNIERPCFQYDPILQGETTDYITDEGVTVIGIDILPSEVPLESSEHFGEILGPIVLELAKAKRLSKMAYGIDISLLPPQIADACITGSDGKVTRKFRYLEPLLERSTDTTNTIDQVSSMVLVLTGHLFDTSFINQVLDIIEDRGCGFSFENYSYSPLVPPERGHSCLQLRVWGDTKNLDAVDKQTKLLVNAMKEAEASVKRKGGINRSPAVVEQERKILIIGAGRVSKCVCEYLGRTEQNAVTVVGESYYQARQVASVAKKGIPMGLDVTKNKDGVATLVKDSHIVISLLPAPMHTQIALECIKYRRPFVTASYESPELRSMRERIDSAGVVFLNEVGLDPGLDHMSVQRMIDDVHSRGGVVTSFSSVCGGLPAPEAASNPLRYRFSWSPVGVLRASQNPAQYRINNRVISIPGDELLNYAEPFMFWPDLDLECIPNRDSLKYEHVYGIEGVPSIFRGTLRFAGFSNVMRVLRSMGLFADDMKKEGSSFLDVVNQLRMERGGFQSLEDFVLACSDEDTETADKVCALLAQLDAQKEAMQPPESVLEYFSRLLENQLALRENERDMVVMHNSIEADFDSKKERHASSLCLFGDGAGTTAMAKTVGLTTAAATDLILNGSLDSYTGLLLPTVPAIYNPVLEIVAKEGVHFDTSTYILKSPRYGVAL